MYHEDWFGDEDAMRDKNLFECFVELTTHKDALEPNYFSVRAFKGSGKTAFVRQLEHCSRRPTECYNTCPLTARLCDEPRKLIIIPIDVNEISFQTLVNLTHSKNDPRHEITEILREILKTAVVSELLRIFNHTNEFNDATDNIQKLIKKKDIIGRSRTVVRETLGLAERVFTSSTDTAKSISALAFNDSTALQKAYDACCSALKINNTYTVVILDKFDRILDLFKKSEQERYFFHQTIATSLLELAYSDSVAERQQNTPFPNHHIQFTILFPDDLYSTLRPRDLQKYNRHCIDLRWSKSALEQFMGKRIAKLLDIPHSKRDNYHSITTNMFSRQLYNTYYEKLENTIEYILRHTLFKPRDLQEVCIAITGEFIKKRGIRTIEEFRRALPFDTASIKNGIKEGTMKIADYLCIELQSLRFSEVLGALRNKPNIIPYSTLYNYILKATVLPSDWTLEEFIRLLCRIGLIGKYIEGDRKVAETYSKQKLSRIGEKYYVALFSFSWGRDLELSRDDFTVIAPMFYDHLDTDVDKQRPIYPF